MEVSAVCRLLAKLAQMRADEVMEYIGLVRLAIQRVESELRPGVDPEENRELLQYVAAADAYYSYCVMRANLLGTESVKTGEVTLTADAKSAVASAKAIRDDFYGRAAGLLQDTGFYFGSAGF